MTVVERVSTSTQLPEGRWMLTQLQRRALPLVSPPLLICGLAFLGYPWHFHDPVRGERLGLAVWLGVLAVWTLSRLSACAAGWALSLGCLALELAVVSWAGLEPAAYLLALPPVLCAITVSAAAGAGPAVACTGLLLWAPAALLPVDAVQRAVILAGMWSTLGLVLLTLQPLLTALQWSWSSYEQSRRLLDRSRDYHVQLKQTLKGVADTNLQLTRLNRLAQGLREAAEDARAAKGRFVANVSHELRTPLKRNGASPAGRPYGVIPGAA